MAANLAPVYLDDNRIRLQGDPQPKVSKILEAGGKGQSGKYSIMQLESQSDATGRELRPEDTIDRTQHVETGVYLKCITKGEAKGTKGEETTGGMGKSGSQFGAQAQQAREGSTFGKQESKPDKEGGISSSNPGSGRQESLRQQSSGSNLDKTTQQSHTGKRETATPGSGGDFGGTREAGKANQQGTERLKGNQEFGRQDSDVEQEERTGDAQGAGSRSSSAEQKEWKAGVEGTGSHTGARQGQGGQPDLQGKAQAQEEQGTDNAGARQGRGNRPKRSETEGRTEGEEHVG